MAEWGISEVNWKIMDLGLEMCLGSIGRKQSVGEVEKDKRRTKRQVVISFKE